MSSYQLANPVSVRHELECSVSPPAQNLTKFVFGAARNAAGTELAVDGVSLLGNGRRIMPVMGEIHYARYPRSEWWDALLKMKAGGVDVVASYVFWIHHEEVEGQWDWSGDRDLRAFVKMCREAGLRCIVRIGPWCHGEVRNGGFPEWLLDKALQLRSNDLRYLDQVRRLYCAIVAQLRDLLWKDGGPVIGVQIENEYGGDPQHLLRLKQMAFEAGLDVPLYTRTGWPELDSPMPFGHLLPLFGGYAEGFWDRSLESMPGHYWKEFVFKRVRTDAAIASEHFGVREVEDAPDTVRYPYLTCEIGPGMPSSYHRRITVFPMDVLSMVIVKLGSGSNSPGYYMYHGGTNPMGREPWLQEHQATRDTNWNDLPVKSYDFQTCLGEFGQVRGQYHLLRPVHLFLRDFGDRLASMAPVLPDEVIGKCDTETLRWTVRTDGCSGFVFINNYHRLTPMPAKPDVQLTLRLKDRELTFPQEPIQIAGERAFFWPFDFHLGDAITLAYATGQPVCQVRSGGTVYTLFSETGNAAEFVFTGHDSATAGWLRVGSEDLTVRGAVPGTRPVVELVAGNGVMHQIVLLDEETLKTCYKGEFGGRERVVLTPAGVMFDGGNLRLASTDSAEVPLWLLPAPASLRLEGKPLHGVPDGAFTRYILPVPQREEVAVKVQPLRDAGPPRVIPIGARGVAVSPTDADFDQAAVWRITLPPETDPSRRLLLRIHYTGDVARAYVGETLLTDNFYNGSPFDIGLSRYGREALEQGITLKILPLRKGAPIHMLDDVLPDFGLQSTVLSLDRIDVIESYEMRVDCDC